MSTGDSVNPTSPDIIMPDPATLLPIPATTPGERLVPPMMQFFDKTKFKNTSVWQTVQLLVEEIDGNYMSVGHDAFPIDFAMASSSKIHTTIKKSKQGIDAILLPKNNAKAYQVLFDTVLQSFQDGKFIEVMTITLNDFNTPVAAYSAMAKVATDLSMVRYKNDLDWRISQLLFPNLNKKWFAVRAFDITLHLTNLGVTPGAEFYELVANGLARAWVAKSIMKSEIMAYYTLFKKNDTFKGTFEKYKTIWSARKAAGEDICNAR